MNKLKYLLLATVLISLISCGNRKESKEKQDDSLNNSNNSEAIEHPSQNTVDFYAYTDDWKLSVQFDNKITLTSASKNINYKGEIEKTFVAQGADVVNIFSSNDNEIVKISIDIVSCKEKGKRLDIMHRLKTEKVETDLSGCGYYRGNPKLHDVWAVTHINDEELNPEKFPKDIPHFEMNLENKRFSGFAGCNQVNGMMHFEYKKMFIQPLSSTKMYCAELSDIENKILSILRNEPIFYTVKGTKLILETTEGTITLKKVD